MAKEKKKKKTLGKFSGWPVSESTLVLLICCCLVLLQLGTEPEFLVGGRNLNKKIMNIKKIIYLVLINKIMDSYTIYFSHI